MVSTIAFLTNLGLLAFMALAVPTSKLDALLSRRHINDKPQPVSRDTNPSIVKTYDPDLAGVKWEEDPDTFSIITGTFAAPIIYGVSGTGLATWIGIGCSEVTLLVGIISEINSDGNPEYRPLYKWLPEHSGSLNVDIHAGDVITATAFAFNETSGRVIIDNKTTGVSAWQDLTSSTPLCREDAVWAVEDYKVSTGRVPLAHFDPVEFASIAAYDTDGNIYTPALINVYDILQPEGAVRTSTYVLDDTIVVLELNDP